MTTKSKLLDADAQKEKLSDEDILRRLFAPATYLPEERTEKSIVTLWGPTERAVSHRQIENTIAYAAEQFKEHGVKADDKVVFYCENSPEFSSALLACWTLNAMVVLVDYRAERADVLKMSQKLSAKYVVTSKHLYKNFGAETKAFADAGLNVLEISAVADFGKAKSGSTFDLATLDLERPAFTILTSGTTGTPKASVHTLGSLALNIKDLAAASGLDGTMTALTPLPISHIFGLSVFLVTQVLGMKAVLTSLDPVAFVKGIHWYKPELIAALPQFYGALFSAPEGYIDLTNAKLLLCGGAPLHVSLADKFEQTFGKQLHNGYGSTESKIVALNQTGPALCVGKPIGAVKIEIVDDEDKVLPEGELGEVRIGSKMLMEEYLDNEEETNKVLRDDYYYTGDLGRFEDGFLFVVGRKKDQVNVDGQTVYAGEVEEVFRKHPEVKEIAVIAAADEQTGECVKACVVVLDEDHAEKLKSKKESEAQEAQRELQEKFTKFCAEHLESYQCPTQWNFIDPHEGLPKTLAGKIDKKKLAESK